MLIECPRTADQPLVQRLEELNWSHNYLYNIQKIMMNRQAYQVVHCLPSIPDMVLGDEYKHVSSANNERLTALSLGLFL